MASGGIDVAPTPPAVPDLVRARLFIGDAIAALTQAHIWPSASPYFSSGQRPTQARFFLHEHDPALALPSPHDLTPALKAEEV
jgi:hypothetical protein